jgi:iron complex transport system substrate-binding protein
MSDDGTTTTEAPARRDTIKYGGAVVGGGLLAGCSSRSRSESTTTGEPTDTQGESWEVTIEPSGTRTFTEIPGSYTVRSSAWLDIMASIGQIDKLAAFRHFETNFVQKYYDALPGVDITFTEGTQDLPTGDKGADKEYFYEVDPDLNLMDPYAAAHYYPLDEGDVEELEENVAPFFGTYMRRQDFTDQHPYYSLYEGAKRAARIFREEERFAALKQLHDEFISDIQSQLPEGGDSRSYAFFNFLTEPPVTVRKASLPGYENKPMQDLRLRQENDAFAGQYPEGERSINVDFEALLEADPEMLICKGGPLLVGGVEAGDTTYTWEEHVVGALEDDPVASEVTAVKEGNVFVGTASGPGPVANLFNTENLAQQLYPEEFGEFDIDDFPGGNEQLFDRQRVADIINGDF